MYTRSSVPIHPGLTIPPEKRKKIVEGVNKFIELDYVAAGHLPAAVAGYKTWWDTYFANQAAAGGDGTESWRPQHKVLIEAGLRRVAFTGFRGAIMHTTVSNLAHRAYNVSYKAGKEPVTSATVRQRDDEVRINRDLMEATAPVALAAGDWVVLWKDPNGVRFPGMTAEEMQVPFDIGICKGAYPAEYAGTSTISVHLYRQLKGNPNGAFTPLLDDSRKPWVADVQRQCVMTVNPPFRKGSRSLNTKGRRQILETKHHSLEGWVYKKGGQGLIYIGE